VGILRGEVHVSRALNVESFEAWARRKKLIRQSSKFLPLSLALASLSPETLACTKAEPPKDINELLNPSGILE
jgi:hypothetical protein